MLNIIFLARSSDYILIQLVLNILCIPATSDPEGRDVSISCLAIFKDHTRLAWQTVTS